MDLNIRKMDKKMRGVLYDGKLIKRYIYISLYI